MSPVFEKRWSNQKKALAFDALVAALSLPMVIGMIQATPLRFSHSGLSALTSAFILAAIFKVLALIGMKLSRAMWTFFSLPDFRQVVKGALLSGAISAALLAALGPIHLLESLAAGALDAVFLATVLTLARWLYRYRKDHLAPGRREQMKRTLIIGAGAAGDQLVRELQRRPDNDCQVIGFIDDDVSVLNRSVHGIRVLGTLDDLERLITGKSVHRILIAIPSATPAQLAKIAKRCVDLNVDVKTLPTLEDLLNGRVHLSSLRPVNIEDLLGREPVELDSKGLGAMITGKTILVSGGGGSIGSELCKQILKFKPKHLVIFEMCEYFLFRTENSLKEIFPQSVITPVVGDVRDRDRVQEILRSHGPDIVFHAAAYKHVPMMEHNPSEAVKTNIHGTQVMAEEAADSGVKKFVLISTDKAVNPTNVMGATKRVAEMICQDLNDNSDTAFIVLRFGNVLGSAGSAVPLFLERIQQGKPLQITHPEITRYFMSIPEATQLVLQAGSLGKGGEIFLLDMGKPIKIVDLAHDLIRLSGAIPGKDINIEFTGLRPGEKLYEELLSDEENTLPTSHPKVRVAKARHVPANLRPLLAHLLQHLSDEAAIRPSIQKLVPEYAPSLASQGNEHEDSGPQ